MPGILEFTMRGERWQIPIQDEAVEVQYGPRGSLATFKVVQHPEGQMTLAALVPSPPPRITDFAQIPQAMQDVLALLQSDARDVANLRRQAEGAQKLGQEVAALKKEIAALKAERDALAKEKAAAKWLVPVADAGTDDRFGLVDL